MLDGISATLPAVCVGMDLMVNSLCFLLVCQLQIPLRLMCVNVDLRCILSLETWIIAPVFQMRVTSSKHSKHQLTTKAPTVLWSIGWTRFNFRQF